MHYQEVIDFWFSPAVEKKYWIKDPDFDQEIRQRFQNMHTRVASGEMTAWRKAPLGRLAEIIVLDQFSRNMFRGKPESFTYDKQALALSLEAIDINIQKNFSSSQKAFLYMPLMHSEDKEMHEKAVQLYAEKGLEENLKFELLHKNIIDQFGRYPHRNKILGRKSTPSEELFLHTPGSSF